MEGSLWALIHPVILCRFPFDILLRTQSLCCHAMLFPRSLWHHKEQLQRRLPFGVTPNSSFCDMIQRLFAIHKNFLKNPGGWKVNETQFFGL